MDLFELARAFAALLVTLGLVLGGLVLLRRFAPHLAAAPKAGAPRPLEVLQSAAIDPRRRLVVVRFGGREHLLLLGATGETVIASGLETVVPEVYEPGDPALAETPEIVEIIEGGQPAKAA